MRTPTFGPPVTIHAISREASGVLALAVAIGARSPQTYHASVDANGPDIRVASCDDELFFELSELSLRRYADSTRYHLELVALLTAFARGTPVMLPARLGATAFTSPLGVGRFLRNHIRRLLFELGVIEPKVYDGQGRRIRWHRGAAV